MREYLLVLAVAVAFTYFSSGLYRRLAFRYDAVAKVRVRDMHHRPMPYFGGLAMLTGLAASLLVASQLPWLGRFAVVSHDALTVLIAGAVICAVGVVDDIVELNALAKTAGQVLAAGIAVIRGVRIYWIPLPDVIYALGDATSILLTVVLIFVIVNAINFVDGLDGLAAGVVAIGAAAFFSYSYLLCYEQDLVRATTASLTTIGTVGICLGFLPHNVHRAKMFMGDSGAMLLGFLLATSVISLTGQIDPSRVRVSGSGLFTAYLPLILPLAVLALPLLDLILAYIRRTKAGQLWFVADKQHIHHRMLQMGHSHRQAVFLLWLWAAVISFGVVLIGVTGRLWTVVAMVAGLILAAGLTLRPGLRRPGLRRPGDATSGATSVAAASPGTTRMEVDADA